MQHQRTTIVFSPVTHAHLEKIRESVQFRYGKKANSLHTRAAIHYLSQQSPETVLQALDDYLVTAHQDV
jgi:hypothetical protein